MTFTTTGQPAAKSRSGIAASRRISKGKLLAPKTTTGPIGINILRISDEVSAGDWVKLYQYEPQPTNLPQAIGISFELKIVSCAVLAHESSFWDTGFLIIFGLNYHPNPRCFGAIVLRNRASFPETLRYILKASVFCIIESIC